MELLLFRVALHVSWTLGNKVVTDVERQQRLPHHRLTILQVSGGNRSDSEVGQPRVLSSIFEYSTFKNVHIRLIFSM